jgi:hypothetical protein
MDKKRFRELFPHLAEEMEEGTSRVDLTFAGEGKAPDREWAGYEPGVADFLRRCDTEEQAREIIGYLESRGELTGEEASRLLRRLSEEGLRSFGGKKGSDFYEHGGRDPGKRV